MVGVMAFGQLERPTTETTVNWRRAYKARRSLELVLQDHAYTGHQAMHEDVRADTTQGGAWLQSRNFGWVGLDSLMDRHGCW